MAADPLARQVADLQLQLVQLKAVTKETALPEVVKQMRVTLKWSALVVAVALLISSLLRIFVPTPDDALVRRVERLERMQREHGPAHGM